MKKLFSRQRKSIFLKQYPEGRARSVSIRWKIIKLQNHRTVWAGEDQRSSSSNPHHGLVAAHWIRLARAPTNLALKNSHVGFETVRHLEASPQPAEKWLPQEGWWGSNTFCCNQWWWYCRCTGPARAGARGRKRWRRMHRYHWCST